MLDIGVGLSTAKDPALAAKEAVRQASLNMVSERADLAIVFSSHDLASQGLLKSIAVASGGVAVIGSSGSAVITNQGVFKHGLAVMLLNIPPNIRATTACVRDFKAKSGLGSGRELTEKLLVDFQETPRALGLILTDGLIEDTTNLIAGMRERLGRIFPILVGSASGNTQTYRTYLYFNQEVLMDSALGILWGGKVSFGLGSHHGWKPLGKPRTVTKARGNLVEEIDGEYAFKIYEEYFGGTTSELRKNFRIISMLYPLGINVEGEGNYLLRNAVAIEENNGLRLQADIKQGSIVKLMLATKESCLQASRDAAEEAKKNLTRFTAEFTKASAKKAVLVFESLSRQMLLSKNPAEELRIIQEVFGADTPIMGLYTYGEQAPLNVSSYYQSQTYFHNQAISVLAFGG